MFVTTRRGWMAGTVMAACSAVKAADSAWPQWRGPLRDGRISDAAWPTTLSETNLKPLWREEFGPSYSGPVVGNDVVFVTETKDSKLEVVHALDRATGKRLWQREWAGALRVPFFARENGDWIRSTPTFDGDALYVAGMRDLLVCLDAGSGSVRWQLDFVSEYKKPVPAFGFVCSPLVVDGSVYVQAGAGVARIDKTSGKVVWRTLDDGGGMWGSAFSSPVSTKLCGVEQLVVQTREQLAGVSMSDGSVLWTQKVPAFRGMNILTPTIWGDAIFTSSYGGKSSLYRVIKDGDTWRTEEVWTNKTQGYMSSPIVHEGHAYLHLKNQRVTCIDLQTGKETWTTKPYGKYWSMIASGDRALALDQRGELFYLHLTPEKFDLLGSHKISEQETWAHLAISDNQLFIRELNALAAFDWV